MVHLELKNKEIQKESRVQRLDKRVNRPKPTIDQSFFAKLPLLENGLITGTRNRVASVIK
ncbi:hypothetical protein IGI39_004714 [Enterococcus sp. AZ135]